MSVLADTTKLQELLALLQSDPAAGDKALLELARAREAEIKAERKAAKDAEEALANARNEKSKGAKDAIFSIVSKALGNDKVLAARKDLVDLFGEGKSLILTLPMDGDSTDTLTVNVNVPVVKAKKAKSESTSTVQRGQPLIVDNVTYINAASAKSELMPDKADKQMSRSAIVSALRSAGHTVSE